MPIYVYVCDLCRREVELFRTMADRENPVVCPGMHRVTGDFREEEAGRHEAVMATMRQKVTMPTVHYKGHGWTRTPAIMRESIADGHPGQRENWGVGSSADYGDPNVISPYKHVIGGDGSDLGTATVGPDGKSVVEVGE